MPVRNPSEIARLEDEQEHYTNLIKSKYICKRDKEYYLGRLREVEASLGVKGCNYNSSDWGE